MGFFNIKEAKYGGDRKYSTGLKIPDYTPDGRSVELSACYDKTKYNELIQMINASKLPEEKKAIYRVVATRFIEYNFDNFAEVYANLKTAPDQAMAKEEQEVMEKLALVIIDINDAIHNGFVKMNSFIKDVIDSSKSVKSAAPVEEKKEG